MNTYCDLPFRSLAESSRVMHSIKPERIITNCLNACKSNQYPIVYYFYPPESDTRLSDEDFREIFYFLTDAHIEEVDDDPDPIHLLSKLSEVMDTTMNAGRALSILKSVLDSSIDNEQRAVLMRPLFGRINSRDLHPLIMRMSVRGGVVRRRNIIAALAWTNGKLFYQIKRASYLVGLERTCSVLSTGGELWPLIQPKKGIGMVIPSPSYRDSPNEIKFSKCYMEYPEGEWMSLHIMKDRVMLFDSSGKEKDIVVFDYQDFPEGIYLVEYASGRDVEMMVCDILFDGSADFSYEQRREVMENTLPKWAIKKVKRLNDPTDAAQHISEDRAVILWNAEGIHTFENTHYEMVILSAKKKKQPIFKIVSGRWVESIHGSQSSLVGKWRIAARDGDTYYPVGLIESEPHVAKRLKSFVDGGAQWRLNDEFKFDRPVFVEVEVNAGGWGDYGPYIHGRIVGLASEAGRKDCIGIEEIDLICGMGGNEEEREG